MNTNKILLNDKEYLKIELIEIKQGNNYFFISKIPFKYLKNTYTVRPLRYDIKLYESFCKKFTEDEDYYRELINNAKKMDREDFQRDEDKKRIVEISQYLNENKIPLFPNSIIATCDLANTMYIDDNVINVDENDELSIIDIFKDEDRNSPRSVLSKIDNKFYLYTPYQNESIIIIDGQHRLKGLDKSFFRNDYEFELLISFIIGYNRSVIANQFYTINYTQKPVNKSQLYHLMGQFSSEITEKTFLHGIVRILNESDKSPLYNRIKMLGVKPSHYTTEQKFLMTVSQAFIIDYLISTLGKKKTGSDYQPIFRYYYDNNMKTDIARFVIEYLKAIQRKFRDTWNSPEKSIVSKTLSIGAFIKIMQLVFVKIFIDEWKKNPEKIKSTTFNELTHIFNGIDKSIFDPNGIFSKGASAGNLSKLKNEIINSMDFFPGSSLDIKLENYRINYLNEYKQWLSNNLY